MRLLSAVWFRVHKDNLKRRLSLAKIMRDKNERLKILEKRCWMFTSGNKVVSRRYADIWRQ